MIVIKITITVTRKRVGAGMMTESPLQEYEKRWRKR